MIILAHGMPKSGSTFLYQVIRDLAEIHNGASSYEIRERYLSTSPINHEDFYTTIDDETLIDAMKHIPDDVLYVIKSHGMLSNYCLSQLGEKKLYVFYSYRDPRDVALSMLDAGRQERDHGIERYFYQFSTAASLLDPIRLAFTCVEPLMKNPDAFDYPYFIIAEAQDWVIRNIAEKLGLGARADCVTRKYVRAGNTDTIVEFNKGIYDRFLSELDAETISALTEALGHEIGMVDKQSRDFAERENLSLLYSNLIQHRDQALLENCRR